MHIKSLSKGAASGHVSLNLEAGMCTLNNSELLFATVGRTGLVSRLASPSKRVTTSHCSADVMQN